MNKKKIGIIGLLILSTAIVSGIVLQRYLFTSLTAAEDSYVSISAPSEVNGDEEELVIEYNKCAAYLLFEIEEQIDYVFAHLSLSFISISEAMEFRIYIMYDNWDELDLAYYHRPVPHWFHKTINFTLVQQDNPSIVLDLTPYVNDKDSIYNGSLSLIITARSEGKAVLASKESTTDMTLPVIHWSPTIFSLPYIFIIIIIALGTLALYDNKREKKPKQQPILMVKRSEPPQKEDILPIRVISGEQLRTYKVGLRVPEPLVAPYAELIARLEVLKCHKRVLRNNNSYEEDPLFSKKLANASEDKRTFYLELLKLAKLLTDLETDHQIREVSSKLELLKTSNPIFTNMMFTKNQIKDFRDPNALEPSKISLKDYQYVAGESLKLICTHFNTRAVSLSEQVPLTKTSLVDEAVQRGTLKGKMTSRQSYKSKPEKAIEDIVDIHGNIDQMAFYQMANAYEALYTLREKVEFARGLMDPSIQGTADFSASSSVLLSYYSIPRHLKNYLAKAWNVEGQWVRNTLVGWRRKIDSLLPDKFQVEALREEICRLALQYQTFAQGEDDLKVISILQRRQILHLLPSQVIDLSPLIPSELRPNYVRLKETISNAQLPSPLEGFIIPITPQEFTARGQNLKTEAENNLNSFPQGSRPRTNIQTFINKIDYLLNEVQNPKLQELLQNFIVGNRYTSSAATLLKTDKFKHLFTAIRGIVSNTLAAQFPSAIGQLLRSFDPALCLTRPFKSKKRNKKFLPAELTMNKYVIERKEDLRDARFLPNRANPRSPYSQDHNATLSFSQGKPIWLGINIYTPEQVRDGLIQERRKGIFWFQLIPNKKIIKAIQGGAQVRHIRLNPPRGPTRKIVADIVLSSRDSSAFAHEGRFIAAFDKSFPRGQFPKGEYLGVDFNRISEYMVAAATEAQEIDLLPMMGLYKKTAQTLERIRTEQIPAIQRKLSVPDALSSGKRRRMEAHLTLLHQRQGKLRKEVKRQSLMVYLYAAHKTGAKYVAWDGIQGIFTRGTKGKLATAITNLPKRKQLYDDFLQWADDLKHQGILPNYEDTIVVSPYTSQICSECFKTTGRAARTLRKGIPWDEFECTICGKHSNRHSNAAHVSALQLQHNIHQVTPSPISSNDG